MRVRSKIMVEGNVLLEDHYQVLNGSCGRTRGCSVRRRNTRSHGGQQCRQQGQHLPTDLVYSDSREHSSSVLRHVMSPHEIFTSPWESQTYTRCVSAV